MLAKKLRATGFSPYVRWFQTGTLTSTTQSIDKIPQSGDLLLWFYYTDDAGGDPGDAITGWTQIKRQDSSFGATASHYKISNGTETSIRHGVNVSASLALGTYILACFKNVNSVASTDGELDPASGANISVLPLGIVGATDICIQCLGVDDQVSGVAVPSGFTKIATTSVGTAEDGCTVSMCYAEGSNTGNWTHDNEPTSRVGLRYTQ